MAAATDPVAAEPGAYLEPAATAERPESLYETVLARAASDDGLYLPHHDMTIDEHRYLVQVVDIQFDEEFGAPYWQEMHDNLKAQHGEDFDIRMEVRTDGYDAIREYLPEADEEALVERSMTEFVPQLYEPEDIDISKSSGTTGPKKLMPWSKAVSAAAVDWYSWNLEQYDVDGGNWLVCGPYGLYEKHLEGAANSRGGFAYFSGIEMREIKDQLAAIGELTEEPIEALKDPRELPQKVSYGVKGLMAMSKTLQVLEEDLEREPVSHIASAPPVVERLHESLQSDETVSDPEDIETILVSGASVTEDAVSSLSEQYKQAEVIPMYATSFTGPAFDSNERSGVSYYPMRPVTHLRVVDSDGETVPYNESDSTDESRGRVEINRIGPDFFWPNQRERETAVRERSTEQFNWDGISNVRPLE